jgi:hypothetical protein
LTRLALVLTGCGLGLAGCGVTTSEQAYTAPLIAQVGAGSVALASLVPTLRAEAKAAGVLSDPATQQATAYLAEGQLNKLSQSDLVRMATANRNAAAHVGGVLAKLDQLTASLRGATVNTGSYPTLPSGSKTFIADWNQYLTTSASDLRNVRQGLAGMSPVYNEFQSLLRAAYNTAKLRSTVQFDNVRRSVFKDIGPRFTRMQNAMQAGVRAGTAVEKTLVSLVNNNQEAQAIVTRVNQEYPSGFLAQEFKKQ